MISNQNKTTIIFFLRYVNILIIYKYQNKFGYSNVITVEYKMCASITLEFEI